MNPLLVGGAVAAIMAGPSLYGMVQSGQLDGSSALGRGLLVAGACAAGAWYVLNLLRQYEKEADVDARRKQQALLTAVGEAEEAKRRRESAENQQRRAS